MVARYRPAGNFVSGFRYNVAKGSFNEGYCRGRGGRGLQRR